MNLVESQIQDKEEELKSLACDLSEALKDLNDKQVKYKEANVNVVKLEKRIKKWTEMIQQEKQDNEIILAKIQMLEKSKSDQ